jgi:hypothetical protein
MAGALRAVIRVTDGEVNVATKGGVECEYEKLNCGSFDYAALRSG